MFGYSSQEISRLKIEDLIPENLRKKHTNYRNNFSIKEQSREMRSLGSAIIGRTKQGNSINLSIAISSKLIDGVMHSVCIIRDITEHNELKDQAEHDYLTTVYNRRTIDTIINTEIKRSIRLQKDLSLLLIDIDNFKSINDNLGHATGDEALKIVTAHLQKHIRPYDHLGRWGGDEFLVLCPALSESDSYTFADRIRESFEEHSNVLSEKITLSIGITTLNSTNILPYNLLLKQADDALYTAKKNGRNRVVHASNDPILQPNA